MCKANADITKKNANNVFFCKLILPIHHFDQILFVCFFIQGEGVIEYAYTTDIAKGGRVGQMLTASGPPPPFSAEIICEQPLSLRPKGLQTGEFS